MLVPSLVVIVPVLIVRTPPLGLGQLTAVRVAVCDAQLITCCAPIRACQDSMNCASICRRQVTPRRCVDGADAHHHWLLSSLWLCAPMPIRPAVCRLSNPAGRQPPPPSRPAPGRFTDIPLVGQPSS